jgi:hypothetical protein
MLSARIGAAACTVRFRIALATVVIALHLIAFAVFARVRFEQPFSRAPESAPAFAVPTQQAPPHWNRLAVSRWDSQHYINLGLRGYGSCPERTKRTARSRRRPRCSAILHEGVWVAAAFLWLALGHREATRGFSPPARAFWYALLASVLGVSLLGSISRNLIGMNRYLLGAIPLFFAMGKGLERRPLALAIWLSVCAWHSWNVDMCFFTSAIRATRRETLPRIPVYGAVMGCWGETACLTATRRRSA